VRGAQGIGEMLVKNASLVKIDIEGEWTLNIPSSSVVIEHSLVEDVHPKRVNFH
jgi:hypothetical protein